MWLLALFAIFFLILLNGFFSASEFALISLRKSRMRHLAKTGSASAKKVQKLLEEPERFLSAVQIGVTLMGTLASAIGGVLAVKHLKPLFQAIDIGFIRTAAEPFAVAVVVTLITYTSIVIGELVPKTLAIKHAEGIAFAISKPIDFFSKIVYPLIHLLAFSSKAILRFFHLDSTPATGGFISEDEIKYLIREGRKSGVFEPSEEDLIHSVFKFTDTMVREVMVPRTEIIAVDVDSDIDTILRTMNEKGFSRIPIYAGTIDNVIGIVYLKDILVFHIEDKPLQLEAVLRKPYIVPPNKNVSILLKEMRDKRIHLALVGDEYGGTDGLVTMEDLIEEIVGDIRDEQEKELREINEVAANRYIVDGKTDIGKLNARLDIQIPEDEFETIGGFVLGLFGRLPAEGDQIRYNGIMFTVLRLRKNRISRIRVLKYNSETDEKEKENHDNAGTRD